MAPQSGPYNDTYGQSQGGPSAYSAPPAGGYQAPGASASPYQTPGQPPVDPTRAQPYAPQAAPDPYTSGAEQPTSPYRNVSTDASPVGAPAAGGYASATPEQAAADQYGNARAATADAGAAASGDRYTAGDTGYVPGQTGYSPPGVPPYQMPAQPNVVSTPRRDPYYRPGGTSDYAPAAGARCAAGR